jgi:hypothetical protein
MKLHAKTQRRQGFSLLVISSLTKCKTRGRFAAQAATYKLHTLMQGMPNIPGMNHSHSLFALAALRLWVK